MGQSAWVTLGHSPTSLAGMFTLRITVENHDLLPTAHETVDEAHLWLARRAERLGFSGDTDADAGGDESFSWHIETAPAP